MGNSSAKEDELKIKPFSVSSSEISTFLTIQIWDPLFVQNVLLQIFVELNSLSVDPQNDKILFHEITNQLPNVIMNLIYEYNTCLSVEQYTFFCYLFYSYSQTDKTWDETKNVVLENYPSCTIFKNFIHRIPRSQNILITWKIFGYNCLGQRIDPNGFKRIYFKWQKINKIYLTSSSGSLSDQMLENQERILTLIISSILQRADEIIDHGFDSFRWFFSPEPFLLRTLKESESVKVFHSSSIYIWIPSHLELLQTQLKPFSLEITSLQDGQTTDHTIKYKVLQIKIKGGNETTWF